MATEQERTIKTKPVVEYEAKLMLRDEGIKVPSGILVETLPSEFDLKYPVALKVSDPRILHKTDVGGVKLNIQSAGTLKSELRKMKRLFPESRFLIEEMQKGGAEFIIGVTRDRVFGHVLMLGAGGIYTELYRDVSFRKMPISERDASEMISEIKSGAICKGFRGIKINCNSLVNLLVSVSRIVTSGAKGIEAMDLNPVIVNEDAAVVVDAKLEIIE